MCTECSAPSNIDARVGLPWCVSKLASGASRRLLQVALVYLVLACWALWGGGVTDHHLLHAPRLVNSGPSVESLASLDEVALLVDPHNDSIASNAATAITADTTEPVNVTEEVLLSPPAKEEQPDSKSPDVTEPAAVPSRPDITEPAVPASESVEKQPTQQAVPQPATNHSDESGGEEIPSFNEWAQKQLAEAEKRKVQNASEPPRSTPKPASNLKLRSKNYASPDCGAKIVAANSEAVSVSAILSPSRDEYALNPCTSAKIWFVVELCEAVQAKQVELANFELFSSSPKDFSVWVGDRFPTRDWHAVGQFTAQDERNIQSFNLEPHLFGKFMKIELHSHWGSEHFCPVSLLRVYGVSEFDVLYTVEEGLPDARHPDDDDDDELAVAAPGGDAPKNLFRSASDAVKSIVQMAAQVLVKTGDSKNATAGTGVDTQGECGITPLPDTRLCAGCSPAVLRLLACRGEELQAMLASPYVQRSLLRDELCQGRGHNDSYLAALLTTEYLSALCHLLPTALIHHHPPTPSYDNLTLAPNDPFLLLQPSESPSTCSIPPVTKSVSQSSSDTKHEIRPTKTLKEQESSEQIVAPVQPTSLAEPSASVVVPENTTSQAEEEVEEWSAVDTILSDLKEVELDTSPPTTAPPVVPPASTPAPQTGQTTQQTNQQTQLPPPTLVTQPMNGQGTQPPPSQTSQQPVQHTPLQQQQQQQQGQQKESVFVRLANRIKALERNMSLSAQYLEELSKRYKKQVEEMQKAFERTLAAVGEASRQAAQREVQHAESLAALEQRLGSLAATTAALLAERDSWQYKITVVSQHMVLFIVVGWCLLMLARQCSPAHNYRDVTPEPVHVTSRQRSVEELCALSRHRKRRTSEEAVSCEQNPIPRESSSHDIAWRLDPGRRKRRRLRRELRGVSVEELCSGLSPATLAAVRHPPPPHVRPRPVIQAPGSPRNRRHSTESSPLMTRAWYPAPPPSPEPGPGLMFNGVQVETIGAEPNSTSSSTLPQRKASGLRKMVRKLF